MGDVLKKVTDPLGLFLKDKKKPTSTAAAVDPNAAADAARQRNLALLAGGSPTTVFSQGSSPDASISKNTLGST